MQVDLNQSLEGIHGPVKNIFDPKKSNDDLTLKELIIQCLTTEKVVKDDRTGLKEVNQKTDKEKFEDFELGMRIKGKDTTQFTSEEIVRILKLGSTFLDTNIYGALKFVLDKKGTKSK